VDICVRQDDNSRLYIDGNIVLTSAGNVDAYANYTLTPGAHSIDYRISNGTGGAGSYGIFNAGTGGIGFAMIRSAATSRSTPTTSSDGSRQRLIVHHKRRCPADSTPVYLANGATLDLNGGLEMVSSLNDYGSGADLSPIQRPRHVLADADDLCWQQ